MTALDRAIADLKHAMGDRPFVLVYERAHPDAPIYRVQVCDGDNMPHYVALGLLDMARHVKLQESGLLSNKGAT